MNTTTATAPISNEQNNDKTSHTFRFIFMSYSMYCLENNTVLAELYQDASLLPGLLYGSTGLGISLWLSQQITDSDFFRKSIQGLGRISSDLSIEQGITGVGIAINLLFLKKHGKQLSGILNEIDAKVYQQTAYHSNIPTSALYGSIIYFCHRLKYDQAMPNVLRTILSLHTSALTEIFTQRFLESTDVDYRYSMLHFPSLFVYTLSSVLSSLPDKTIWKNKIKALIPKIVEVYPYIAGNRLLYWIALSRLSHSIEGNAEIDTHLSTLEHSISEHSLLDGVNGNVYWGEGVCGIYCMARNFPQIKNHIGEFSCEIESIINSSNEIQHLRDTNYLKNHSSLWNGVAGLKLTGLLMKTDRFRYGYTKR